MMSRASILVAMLISLGSSATAWAFGAPDPQLSLTPDSSCYQVGATVRVTVDLSNGPAPIVGGQFFLSYDNTKLTFVSAAPAPAVWTREVLPVVTGAGTIDYAVGIEDQGSGAVSGTMAILTFTAAAEICDSAGLVSFRAHSPPTRLIDAFDETYSQGTNLDIEDLPAIAIDSTNPSATRGSIAACYQSVADANQAALDATTNLTDNCDPSPTKVIETSAAVACSTAIVVRVSDSCGNFTDYDYNTRVDGTAPAVTPSSNITVPADAGGCTALVSFSATANDNCDGPTPVVFKIGTMVITDSHVFPSGTTTVTVESTDSCGNTGSATFDVTVLEFNEILVSVQLQGVNAPSLNRCITFEVFACPGVPVVVSQVVAFTAGLANSVPVSVPCGSYSCITARDKLHTLRRTAALGTSGSQYTANFIDDPESVDKSLIGGNLNDDAFIDIIDFGIYVNRYGLSYGTGNTTCSTTPYHADVSGNGTVGTEDFTFVQINFLRAREANCCGNGNLTGGPRSSITLGELGRLGMSGLSMADLNRDGVVDQWDIVAFMNGARPERAEKPRPLPSTPTQSRVRVNP